MNYPTQSLSKPTKTSEMKTAVITAPRTIELRTVKAPVPGRNEVRIRLQGSGVCASDLPVWEGRDWFTYPAVPGSPGHEGWGIVDKVGEDVQTIQPGFRVSALCQNAYAEYDIASESQVVELPEFLNDKPFPGEPLACAMNIFRRSQIKKGETVAIIGAGWIGLLLVQLVKKAGAKVIVISRRSSSLEKAKSYQADHLYSLNDNVNIEKSIERITRGKWCDCTIEAAGKQGALDIAGKITGVRGRLVIAGYHQDGSRNVDMQLWNWRGIDVINAHERDPDEYIRGMREAVKSISMGVLNPFPLLTHTFSLNRIGDAFEAYKQKPEAFTKALITIE